jgi:hypothetical protein
MANQDRVGRLFRQASGNQKVYLVDDDKIAIVDPADTTKRIRFDAGSVTTATTRTVSVPDRDFTLGGGAGGRMAVTASAGSLTLTAAMSGQTMLFDAAGATAYALPAIAAADVGVYFDFYTTVTATGNHTITAQTGDLLVGSALMGVTGADIEVFAPDVSDDLIITQNGSTTGGIAGSWVRVVALSATRWGVTAILRCSGAQATPFS